MPSCALEDLVDDADAWTQQRQRLQVVVLYEDQGAGLRAWHALERVVGELESMADFSVGLRRFDLLSIPEPYATVTDELSDADIVFLAPHGRNELPAAVNWWLSHWLTPTEDTTPGALVLSLDADEGETPEALRLIETLKGVAELAGVDLFLHAGQASPMSARSNLDDADSYTNFQAASLDPAFERHSYPHWGLND